MTCNFDTGGSEQGDTRCSTSISSICLISKFVQADPQTRVLLELGRFLRIAGNRCLHSSSFFNHPSETRCSSGRWSGVDRTDQRQATSSPNAKLRRFEGSVPQSSLSTCIGSHHRKRSPEPRFLLCPGLILLRQGYGRTKAAKLVRSGWSRCPGKVGDRTIGRPLNALPDFVDDRLKPARTYQI